jgi:type II secretory pathway pseudopilin PulG
MSDRLPRNHRAGISLIEVLFAIGVVMIGLLGIAAVLPFAESQARNATTLDQGTAIAQRAQQQLRSRGMLDPARWVMVNDFTAAGGLQSTNRYVSPAQARLLWETLLPTPPAINAIGRDNPGGVCIDPSFMALPTNTVDATSTNPPGYWEPNEVANNGFRRGVFPHYKTQFNPLADPSSSGAAAVNNWPVMPRLWRVGVRPGVNSQLMLPAAGMAADQLSVDDDTLSISFPRNRAENASQLIRPFDLDASATDALTPITRQLRPQFTWFATVNVFPGELESHVAVVVVRNRSAFPPTRRTSAGPATRPTDNPEGERVALVTRQSGVVGPVGAFRGGAGGTIELTASAQVSSTIRTGQWIMLSRNVVTPVNPVGWPVYRWYRITGVEQKPRVGAFVEPISGRSYPAWQRWVTVDGSDWSFVFDTSGNGGRDFTVATIVDEAVAVLQYKARLDSAF